MTLKEGRYKDEGKFSLWAKRIAHNLVIDHYRQKSKTSRYPNLLMIMKNSIFDIIKEPDANIEDRLIQIQINDDLYKMIECLPENQREVLELRFLKN